MKHSIKPAWNINLITYFVVFCALALGNAIPTFAQSNGNTCQEPGVPSYVMTTYGDFTQGAKLIMDFHDSQQYSPPPVAQVISQVKIDGNLVASQYLNSPNGGYVGLSTAYLTIPNNLSLGLHSFSVTRTLYYNAVQVLSVRVYCQQIRVFEPLSMVSAAFPDPRVAVDSIGTIYGSGLATTTASAPGNNPAYNLGGSTVTFDVPYGAAGGGYSLTAARLFYASPNQINVHVPTGVVFTGPPFFSQSNFTGYVGGYPYRWLVVATSNGRYFRGHIRTEPKVSPGLFSVSGTGQGVANAVVLRVRNGVQTYEPVYTIVNGTVVPVEIDLGPSTDLVYLILYGTGFRYRQDLQTTICTIGGTPITGPNGVVYAGVNGDGNVGVDQANVLLPRSLIGRKLVNVQLEVRDGTFHPVSNTVQVSIK